MLDINNYTESLILFEQQIKTEVRQQPQIPTIVSGLMHPPSYPKAY